MGLANVDTAAALEKAYQRRREALNLPLKRDFLDDEHWQELARDMNLRLPAWTYPPEPRTMRRWLRKFKVREREYLDIMGLQKLEQFAEMNPDWPLRAWVGILLEYVEQRNEAEAVLRRTPQ